MSASAEQRAREWAAKHEKETAVACFHYAPCNCPSTAILPTAIHGLIAELREGR